MVVGKNYWYFYGIFDENYGSRIVVAAALSREDQNCRELSHGRAGL
jgi:hypothetical protein